MNKMQEQMSGEDGKRLCKNDFTSNLRHLFCYVSLRPKCVISVPLNGIMIIMFPKHALIDNLEKNIPDCYKNFH